jgi:glycolate oxidase iron-sulfur subunit
MQAKLAPFVQNTPDGIEAADILRSCVHCGFCTATCPTYQLLGDELDGPRGRIYLIKQVLEGDTPTAKTQLHLDRCLTCRACETTCPSGVQYGRLLDIGRKLVDQQVSRSLLQRWQRKWLAAALTGRWFAPVLAVARVLRPHMPSQLRQRVPIRIAPGEWPTRHHATRMLLLGGCVQPAIAPNINAATARVFDALGIELIVAPQAGCCGAIEHHLDGHERALAQARRNIDAWWPFVESGVDTLVMNASGCGTMLVEYGHLLRNDPTYAAKARRISAIAKDLAQILPAYAAQILHKIRTPEKQRVVFHPPCSLQHGQGIRGEIEAMLTKMGAQILPFVNSDRCCGAAGTYSLLQADLSTQLRDAKLEALHLPSPDLILSANIGCIAHLAGAARVPVQHWIEWVGERL